MKDNYINYLKSLLDETNTKYDSFEKFQQQKEVKQNYQPGPLSLNIKQSLKGETLKRYCRQMLLPQIKYQGQQAIMKSKVAIVGAGGIGCPLAMYIAAAGIGQIGLFDSDVVEMTNLHRQIGHKTSRIGQSKTTSLKQTLLEINPLVQVQQFPAIDQNTCVNLEKFDIIVDGSDNPKCRYIVNDYCMQKGKKLLSGACIGWQAQITCYGNENNLGNLPCYRCIWGDDQLSLGGCSVLGVLGMVPGIVGQILGVEVLRMAVTRKSQLQGKLLTIDCKNMQFRNMKLRNRKSECQACGNQQKRLIIQKYQYQRYDGCKNVSILPNVPNITWQEYIQKVKSKQINPKIIDVRGPGHYGVVHFENSVNLPFEKLKEMTTEEIRETLNSKKQQIPVFGISCKKGIMSKFGTQILKNHGLQAVNIEGGIDLYGKKFDNGMIQF